MKVAILAEQNFNLVDGSTVWLLNVCRLLAMQPGFELDLLLSHRLENRVLADELPVAARVVEAPELLAAAGLAAPRVEAETVLEVLAAQEAARGRYDRIFVRGALYLDRLLAEPEIRDRVVAYAAGVVPDLSAAEPRWLGAARAARVPLVVQSATAARVMETLADYPPWAIHVVPPAVFVPDVPPPPRDGPVTLCYAGKIDAGYGLDWLADLAEAIAADPGLGLRVIAGKEAWRARHPAFFARMDALRKDVAAGRLPGVSVVSNLPPSRAMRQMAEADFGYCLRGPAYDDVLEVSTKAMEFCALGVPPILNDTALNRDMFGADYPYLIDPAAEDVPARLLEILRGGRKGADHAAARARAAEVAKAAAAPVLAARLGRAVLGRDPAAPALVTAPRRILVATHQPKFLDRMAARLRGEEKLRLDWQIWAGMDGPGDALRAEVPAGVDTVFCEWCCENAVWHSRNKRPGTKLIVRLHRFEAFQPFPGRVDWDKVDALIVVSEWFRDHMAGQYGIDPARIHVLPQYVDWHALRRPKLPEARFAVGLVGIAPFAHKRPDRALDFLAALRARDPRFHLVVRGAMPWQMPWLWNREDDTRARYEALFRRVETDSALAGAVRFDPPGPDMEEWYRGVGAILSSSDSEGCHTAVLEGMASGCLPVVHDWPGARGLYGEHVHADLRAAIPGLIAFAERDDIEAARAALSRRVERHDVAHFIRAFLRL